MHLPENYAKRKYLKKHRCADWQMLILPNHRQRGQGERTIVEGQLERDVHGVKQDFLANEFDVHFFVIEVTGHLIIRNAFESIVHFK